MLAGLSIAHGLVPPHPAPTLAVEIFHADPGKTILLAIIVGLPTGLFAGPIFATLAQAWLHPAGSPVNIQAAVATRSEPTVGSGKENPPDLASVLATILLPPMLMLGRSVVELAKPAGPIKQAIDFIGDPITALLIALFFCYWRAWFSPRLVRGKSAGGGWKQPRSDRRSCFYCGRWWRL